MQTRLADEFRDTAEGREADAILRKCVHCGFCTATCPTYQLLGDELDGPRGRIYLIKEMLEGKAVTARTQLHLDRCLSCRSCETTCPSGVRYGRLLDIGRALVDRRVPRGTADKAMRTALAEGLPRPWLIAPAMRVGRLMRPLLPKMLAGKLPRTRARGLWPSPRHSRRMIVLAGCVQPAMAPDINAAAARVLDRVGISLVEVPSAGCCGALRFHIGAQTGGCDDARRIIDAWWPHLDHAEAIVMTASGCGAFVREYDHLFHDDPVYRARAARVAAMTRDLSEIVSTESDALQAALRSSAGQRTPMRIAFQAPCTLQHAQRIRGVVEDLLTAAEYEVVAVADAHLCCGSAGVYSLLQPEIAHSLRDNKIAALTRHTPAAIATANIGCLAHLQEATGLPVRHWIELVAERLV